MLSDKMNRPPLDAAIARARIETVREEQLEATTERE